jgi:hypothetical protein
MLPWPSFMQGSGKRATTWEELDPNTALILLVFGFLISSVSIIYYFVTPSTIINDST